MSDTAFQKMPDAPPAQNFCTNCGTPLLNGVCQSCGARAPTMAVPVAGQPAYGGYPGQQPVVAVAQPVGQPPYAQAYVVHQPMPVAFMERPPPVGGGWTWLFFLLGFIFPVLWAIGACFACAGPPRERAGGRACLCMLTVAIVIVIVVVSSVGSCPDYGSNCGEYTDETCCEREFSCYWGGGSSDGYCYYD